MKNDWSDREPDPPSSRRWLWFEFVVLAAAMGIGAWRAIEALTSGPVR